MRNTLAVAISLVATAFFAVTATGSLGEQDFGLTTVPASNSCALMVTGVAAHGGAGGLRAGDAIEADRLTTHERLRLMVPRSADAMMLPTHRENSPAAMAMVMVHPSEHRADAAYVRLAVLLVVMLLGMFVLWRGRDSASLGLGIFFSMIPAFFLSHASAGLPDQVIVAVLFLATVLDLLGYFGLYVMVDALAAPAVPPRLRKAARWCVAAALSVGCFVLFSSIFARIFTGCPPFVNVQIALACYTAAVAICFVLLWLGITGADPADRGRLRWVLWSTIVGFSGSLSSFAFIALHRPVPLNGSANVTFLAIPLGYTYAVLRHRVIDVGFVLNRALSLTILTTAIVALFLIAESLIEHLTLGHTESMFLQLGFTLGLGMTLNSVHAKLGAWLERLLFRRRYALETSLRALAEHIDTCLDEGQIIREVVTVLTVDLALIGCRVILGDAGASADMSPQERSTLKVPLRVLRREFGAIVLTEDDKSEALAPEEHALLRDLALHVAAAIATLRSEKYEQLLKDRVV